MAATSLGRISWELQRDQEGHRDYKLRSKVRALPTDGPYTVMNASGLPVVGATWNFGGDFDPWAFCWPTMKVSMHPAYKDEPGTIWIVEQNFSTKPLFRCQDLSVEDPMLEPQKVSGSFVKYVKEVTRDKDNNPVKTSSHEMIRGPQAEFDHNLPTVLIEQNVSQLGLSTFSQLVDRVNGTPMWGLGTRRVKLSNASWERKLYGLCFFYYTRSFEFDVNFNGFDRVVLDEGTKVLNGHWEDGVWTLDNIGGGAPDPDNPRHFIRYKDLNGENTRAILDGTGKPWTGSGSPGAITIEYYSEADFLTTLGVPTSF